MGLHYWTLTFQLHFQMYFSSRYWRSYKLVTLQRTKVRSVTWGDRVHLMCDFTSAAFLRGPQHSVRLYFRELEWKYTLTKAWSSSGCSPNSSESPWSTALSTCLIYINREFITKSGKPFSILAVCIAVMRIHRGRQISLSEMSTTMSMRN